MATTPRKANEDTITKRVQAAILRRPSVRECLARGFVNHSALARSLGKELGIEQFHAVLAATKRLGQRLSARGTDSKIQRLLRSTQVRVVSRLAIVVTGVPQNFEKLSALQRQIRRARGRFNMIDGDDFITLLFSQQHRDLVHATLGTSIQTEVTDLAQVSIIFDERIETTPGVVAYVYGLLAFHGVNIREEMSCWTDLMLIVDAKDMATTLEILRQHAIG